jgi:mRNA interferase RelE/StbE
MDACRIEFCKSAEKDLRRIASAHLPRIVEAISALASNPLPPNVRKLADTDHSYRIRVGDYRVIYQFLSQQRLVIVGLVRHRREVYRDL